MRTADRRDQEELAAYLERVGERASDETVKKALAHYTAELERNAND